MVYKRVRGWTSGLEPPRINICWVLAPRVGRCFRLKNNKVASTWLRKSYHNGQFNLQIDTFSLLRRCEATNVALQIPKHNMPRHFHVPANVAYARLSSVWTSKKSSRSAKKRASSAGIFYSEPCQNIYTRPWLNHYWFILIKERKASQSNKNSKACRVFVRPRVWR